MDFGPLLSASPILPVHAFAAMAAFVLGLVQFAGPKGTLSHRARGYLWTVLILTVAASSFGIHKIRQWHGFSLIHLISIYVLASAPLAVWSSPTPSPVTPGRICSIWSLAIRAVGQ